MDAPDTSPFDLFCDPCPDGGFFCRGSAISLDQRGVLALGPSGSGKSRLALDLMALGARLLADDGIWLTANNQLQRPMASPALIEARGIGLLRADVAASAPLALIVDLSRPEPNRLPPHRRAAAPGGPVPLILGQDHPFLAPAIIQYLKQGRAE